MVTREDIEKAIEVLREYATNKLDGDDALLIELEDAIEAAYEALYPEN